MTIIDKRNLGYRRLGVTGERELLTTLEAVSKSVGHTLMAEHRNVNTFTGHLTELKAAGTSSNFVQGRSVSDGELINAAKDYFRSISTVVGFAPEDPIEFEGDSKVTRTSTEIRIVSLQQTLNGIEVWGMEPKVWFNPNGSINRVTGDTVSLHPDLPLEPTVAPEVALRIAAEEAAKERNRIDQFGQTFKIPGLNITGWRPIKMGQGHRASKSTAFEKGPFDEISTASLAYLYMGEGTRLTWRFVIAREFHVAQYLIFVEATTTDAPSILYCRDLTSMSIGGKVFLHNPDEGAMADVSFPLTVNAYPVSTPAPDLPVGFPLPWTDTLNGRVSTEGNNVRAFNGRTRQPHSVAFSNGRGDFNEPVDTPDQYVVNIFYFCNFMHDFFLMLGFTEEGGNFQVRNVTGKGQGADPVHAFAHPGSVYGTANMATRADGQYAVMNMGMVNQTGRHTANDADVVFHEFVHGVTNRLVGGLRDAEGLIEDQSRSMGEGWGDYFALSIRNFSRQSERVVTGTYVMKNTKGIRQRPYDEAYPGTFGDIGKGLGQVSGAGNQDLDYSEEHNVGEIWCAALMELTRKIVVALADKRRGYEVTWLAIVDGLKLTPKNPSFLVARNAILAALAALKGTRIANSEFPKVQQAAWEAFAKFGMGFDAWCPNASFVGCKNGKAMPPNGWED